MVKHSEILAAVTARKKWEDRQTTWYQMRHDGIRRANKPWPNAADMHYPLADTTIEKLKPFYVQQIFASETIAQFTGLDANSAAYQAAAAQWMDDHLKQRSNFEEEIVIATDRMLQHGRAVVKVYWDGAQSRVVFEAVHPLYLIVPPWTTTIDRADWIVHVQHFSRAAYERLDESVWDLKPETIELICGADKTSQYEQTKDLREGITHSSKDDEIIIWEVMSREKDGQWKVRTYAPVASDRLLRKDFVLPYNKAIFERTPPPPYFQISAEIKDRGFYDSRGICERAAPFEASLNKDWNTSKDYQTLTCSPTYYAKNGVGSMGNVQMIPGQILPFEIAAVQYPPVPMDIQQSMVGTRMVFEQAIAIPDFGTGQAINTRERKTATEVQTMASVMGQSTDLRARIFRREVSRGLQMAWALLIQYAREELTFFYLDELKELDQNALDGKYRIEPAGSGDSWNKERNVQEALALFQLLRGDPLIKQDALRKYLLERKDPKLCKHLILDQGTAAAEQIEDQAQELTAMMIGFPAQVKPTDDDLSHLQSLFGFLQRPTATPLSAEARVLIAKHAEEHAAQFKKLRPDQFAQAYQQMAPAMQELQAAAMQAQQEIQMQQMQQQQAPQLPPGRMAP
ncbi:hypothetical protein [Nibricoccus sp. IMCC34717]|uniref:hypothetical protein n=1 Tax=Nibricoccus sp. IMCC34717 TaxID=3034021 RepID=UPI0038513EE0